jgi:hypothetical protein
MSILAVRASALQHHQQSATYRPLLIPKLKLGKSEEPCDRVLIALLSDECSAAVE